MTTQIAHNGTRQLTLHKASAIRDGVIRDTIVSITQPLTIRDSQRLSDLRNLFHTDAVQLVDTLLTSLPGGTIDYLIAELLRRRASSFILPFEHEGKESEKTKDE